ncbi:hypothetical protein ET989_05220 [Propioniciclava sinopodophylli]|uniref:YdhG-like domain-containing protein n=1 Tax=Propioniciclava sinopodophylli TaxID=1837344 RepID=A0A4Q9KGH6_9ACTN|nr:DUF1801 domain-containing protein [Propioniciclava sinopodophylli]TBT85857.1 hypothetical protein ET989_05220 [Propioniciclava sinopodophylli]
MTVIDDYLAEHSGPHREHMDALRAIITRLAPDATQALAWGMPTWKLNGNLVHIAAGKHHVGLYPGGEGVEFVRDELVELGLKFSKGAIQLPVDRPVPVELVERLVAFRVAQQEAKGR